MNSRVIAFSTTSLQQTNANQTAEPIESPNRLIFKSEENGKFENWEATYQIANNLTPKTSFYELKRFFDGLQRLNCYDSEKIWSKAKSYYILIFITWVLALITCYWLVGNIRNTALMMFSFMVVMTI